jgi:hypothetical protein
MRWNKISKRNTVAAYKLSVGVAFLFDHALRFCTWLQVFVSTHVTSLLAVGVCFTPTAFRAISPCLGTFSYRLMQLWSLAADVTVW